MSRLLFLLLLLFPAVLSAGEIYRWVDDNGELHYADRPREGAEVVTLPKAQTFSAPAVKPSTRNKSSLADEKSLTEEALARYKNFEIVSPVKDQVLWNIGGELNVKLTAQPNVQKSHTIFLYMDGQEVQQLAGGQTQANLKEVYRGQHTLRAEVKDSNGKSLAQTNVTFTVQQTSTQSQNRRTLGSPEIPVVAPTPG